MPLPLVKLGTLAIRSFIAKPLASYVKAKAGSSSSKYREYMIKFGQANHRMMTKMQRRNIGRATNAEIHPLDVEKAVQITADFIGEFVLYGVAGVLLSLEYWRSIASEARKEDVRRQELGAIKLSVEDLAGQIEQHRKREEYLVREIETMKHEFEEVKQLAKGRGLAGAFSFKQAPVATKDPKPTATSSPTS